MAEMIRRIRQFPNVIFDSGGRYYPHAMRLDAFEKARLLARVEHLQALLTQLKTATASERVQLRDRAKIELEATKRALRTIGTDPRA